MTEIQLDPDSLLEYSKRLNSHIQQSENLTQSLREVKTAVDELRQAQESKYLFELRQMRDDFNILVKHLQKMGMAPIDIYAEKVERLRPLLDNPEWPEAVNKDMLIETEDGKKLRAMQILDLVVMEYLEGLRFLDYGCGEGYVSLEATQRKAAIAMGYDVEKQWAEDCDNLTTDFQIIAKNAPYDIVLMYDVLDHCKDPVEQLIKVRTLLSNRGRIYVRMHPWCSKHGGHLHKTINKAFAHILLDEIEQMRFFGAAGIFVQKLVNPVKVYRDWFAHAGFTIEEETIIRDDLSPFFANMDNIYVNERISRFWKGEDPKKDLALNYVNYVIKPTQSHQQIL